MNEGKLGSRSEPDAAAAAGIFSTLGMTNVTVSFNWRKLGDDNSSTDKLFFSYNVITSLTTAEMQNEGSWTAVRAAGFVTTLVLAELGIRQ
jgi:hypothetical protein